MCLPVPRIHGFDTPRYTAEKGLLLKNSLFGGVSGPRDLVPRAERTAITPVLSEDEEFHGPIISFGVVRERLY